jgi:hypothetical protein
MRSTAKSILFCRAVIGKASYQWPVAVFNTDVIAKTYAAYLRMAYTAGNVAEVKRLDPRAKTGEDGTLVPEVKYSIVTLPYEPSAVAPPSLEGIEVEDHTS